MLAEALRLLGSEHALVVRGEDGLDELTLFGETRVTEVTRAEARDFCWTPGDFGLWPGDRASLLVSGPEESAAKVREVLAGRAGAPRDIVVLNAAAALWTAGKSEDPLSCAALAAAAIDTGAARDLLARWAEFTNR
jgi:anthranilate phosphoribosyltransferase